MMSYASHNVDVRIIDAAVFLLKTEQVPLPESIYRAKYSMPAVSGVRQSEKCWEVRSAPLACRSLHIQHFCQEQFRPSVFRDTAEILVLFIQTTSFSALTVFGCRKGIWPVKN